MTAILDGVLASPPTVCLALAFGLVYGMLGVMDLSVPIRFAAAAYAGWYASRVLGWYPAADPAVLGAAAAGAVGSNWLCWRMLAPLTRAEPLIALVGSLGIAYLFQAVFQLAFGAGPRVYESYPVESGIAFLGTTATPLQLIAFGYATLAVIGLTLWLRARGLGHRLMISAADPEVAESVFAIDRARLAATTTWIASLLIAPAAVFFAIDHGVEPTTGANIGLTAFVATIVAGRQRPILGAAVALLLVITRSLAVRWSLSLLIAVAAGALLGGWLSRSAPSHTRRLAATLGGAAGLGMAVRWMEVGVEWVPIILVPSGFQEVVPYLLILGCLLAKPEGLMARRATRVI